MEALDTSSFVFLDLALGPPVSSPNTPVAAALVLSASPALVDLRLRLEAGFLAIVERCIEIKGGDAVHVHPVGAVLCRG